MELELSPGLAPGSGNVSVPALSQAGCGGATQLCVMSARRTSLLDQAHLYDADRHVAELYDALITDTDDVVFIRRLIDGLGPLAVLEPFCGTARILAPLAIDGHRVIGLDSSSGMLDNARQKLAGLRPRIPPELIENDALEGNWPSGIDLVILGGNCFYELATPGDQEACIKSAFTALRKGGRLYVDNDHMEGRLAADWQDSTEHPCFPTGRCQDGTSLKSTWRVTWFDTEERLVRFERTTTITTRDGNVWSTTCIQQKHPVSMQEVKDWLEHAGFQIQGIYGDRLGTSYSPEKGRAIFWCVRP